MKINILVIAFTIILFMTGCGSIQVPDSAVTAGLIGTGTYVPYTTVPPIHSLFVAYYDDQGQLAVKPWPTGPTANADVRALLPNLLSEITISSIDSSGKIKFGTAGATGAVGHYDIIFDFIKYYIESAVDPTNKKTIGLARVGVGMRMKASIDTKKANIDLGNLLALGFAASASTLSGTIEAETWGIVGADQVVITPTAVSQQSVQTILTALATLKSKIADPSTVLSPQVLGIKPTESGYNVEQVKACLVDQRGA